MTKTKTSGYDIAEYSPQSEEMPAYLEACLEEASAFRGRIPDFYTILKVIHALGVKLHAEPIQANT